MPESADEIKREMKNETVVYIDTCVHLCSIKCSYIKTSVHEGSTPYSVAAVPENN
jgi:hypothetical protein